jgi:hypothetical protein
LLLRSGSLFGCIIYREVVGINVFVRRPHSVRPPGYLPTLMRPSHGPRLTTERWAISRELMLNRFPVAPDDPPTATTHAWCKAVKRHAGNVNVG